MRYIEKEVTLRTLDQHWREHLAAMDYMRQGIYLRSYAQKNPKQEYKREAFELFSGMLDRIKFDTVTTVSKIQVRSQAEIEREELERQQRLARALQAQHAEAISPIQAAPGADGPGAQTPAGAGNVMELEPRAAAPAADALRARRAQSGPQRALSLRVRAQVQALPRHPAASERLTRRLGQASTHVVAAAVIDARGPRAHRAAPARQAPGRRLGVSRRQTRARRGSARRARARAARRARYHPDRTAPAADSRAPCLYDYGAGADRYVGGARFIRASREGSTVKRCVGARKMSWSRRSCCRRMGRSWRRCGCRSG